MKCFYQIHRMTEAEDKINWPRPMVHNHMHTVIHKTMLTIIIEQALRRQWFAGVRPGVLGGNEPRASPYDN
jgi:hypothetical protein